MTEDVYNSEHKAHASPASDTPSASQKRKKAEKLLPEGETLFKLICFLLIVKCVVSFVLVGHDTLECRLTSGLVEGNFCNASAELTEADADSGCSLGEE